MREEAFGDEEGDETAQSETIFLCYFFCARLFITAMYVRRSTYAKMIMDGDCMYLYLGTLGGYIVVRIQR